MRRERGSGFSKVVSGGRKWREKRSRWSHGGGRESAASLSAVEPNFENVKRQKTDRGHEIAILLAAFALGSRQLQSEPNTVGNMALYEILLAISISVC